MMQNGNGTYDGSISGWVMAVTWCTLNRNDLLTCERSTVMAYIILRYSSLCAHPTLWIEGPVGCVEGVESDR
ncbi:hypothetical protein K439DRAFT_1106890 [Ramaria rubella]|nr:hypothetical protein K439DRAFT_1106890 [Ramaria rubella]